MRPIDADALKDKLQQHHDFYVMAWGGFGKMPISEKKRVDEITNCIAEVVNFPTIEPKREEWIPCSKEGLVLTELMRREGRKWYGYKCSNCNFIYKGNALLECNFCPNCGADMRERENE